MKNVSIMIKPASSLCNFRCRYCFYEDVSAKRSESFCGYMSRETAIRIISNVFSALNAEDSVSFLFQGGEPTLAGIGFFEFFVKEVEKRNNGAKVKFLLQTNGSLLDEDWCRFLKRYHFLVGLSLDALPKVHNEYRQGPSLKGTYEIVKAAKSLLEQYEVDYNVLTVLTLELSKYPDHVWDFMVSENIEYIQFIPCLGELDGTRTEFQLNPEGFAYFYSRLFILWANEFAMGRYRSIKLFDDLIDLIRYGRQNSCGLVGQCMPQLVVESDGRVFPCDFFAVDDFCVGNLAFETMDTIYNNVAMKKFRLSDNRPLDICKTCPYVTMCQGGCKRMRREVCGDVNAKTCGYRLFLNRCMPILQSIIHG